VSRGLRYRSLDAMPPEMRRRLQEGEDHKQQKMGKSADGDQGFLMQPGHVGGKKATNATARRQEEEHEQQVMFFARIYDLSCTDPDRYKIPAERTYAIPNGGRRGKREAWHFQQEGVKAGVSDIHCAIARGGKHGLYIEMKSRVGKASQAQVKWLLDSEREGYEAHCCSSCDEALEVWKAYVDKA